MAGKYQTEMQEEKVSLAGEIVMGCLFYGFVVPVFYTMEALSWLAGPYDPDEEEETSLIGEVAKLVSREEKGPAGNYRLATR